jgi:hypothetical protein
MADLLLYPAASAAPAYPKEVHMRRFNRHVPNLNIPFEVLMRAAIRTAFPHRPESTPRDAVPGSDLPADLPDEQPLDWEVYWIDLGGEG